MSQQYWYFIQVQGKGRNGDRDVGERGRRGVEMRKEGEGMRVIIIFFARLTIVGGSHRAKLEQDQYAPAT